MEHMIATLAAKTLAAERHYSSHRGADAVLDSECAAGGGHITSTSCADGGYAMDVGGAAVAEADAVGVGVEEDLEVRSILVFILTPALTPILNGRYE